MSGQNPAFGLLSNIQARQINNSMAGQKEGSFIIHNMNPITIFHKRVYPFASSLELIDFVRGKHGILVALGAEKLLNEDPAFGRLINTEGIGYCDGVAAQYAVRHRGYPAAAKIRGAALWLELIKTFPADTKYFLVGAKSEVLTDTIGRLQKDYPGIRIVGFRNGFFKPEEEPALRDEIKRSGADVVFVAMGSPKQEFFMQRLLQEYSALYMGLGGSYDLYTERVKPVPDWWIKIFKWEGFYRQFFDLYNLKRWKRQFVVLGILLRFLTGKF